MAIAKRGGARAGAGRRSTLTSEQRLYVGAAVHSRLWRKTRAQFAQALDAKLAEDEIPQMWARFWATRDVDRRRVDRNALDAHQADIQAAIEEGVLQGQRYFPGPTRVADGIRGPTIRSVARAVSRAWGVRISERMAERCLEEYRAINARADAELVDYRPDLDNLDKD